MCLLRSEQLMFTSNDYAKPWAALRLWSRPFVVLATELPAKRPRRSQQFLHPEAVLLVLATG
jgi:hypothetical protein